MSNDEPTPDRPVEQDTTLYADLTWQRDNAEQEVERLRAGIEALRDKAARLGLDEAAEDANALLAGSGEQPGEADRAYAEGRWCGECRYGQVEDPPCCTRPAPAVPDSAAVRERARKAVREHKTEFRGDWPNGHYCPGCSRDVERDHQEQMVLAVVGQGVEVKRPDSIPEAWWTYRDLTKLSRDLVDECEGSNGRRNAAAIVYAVAEGIRAIVGQGVTAEQVGGVRAEALTAARAWIERLYPAGLVNRASVLADLDVWAERATRGIGPSGRIWPAAVRPTGQEESK